MHSLKPTGDNIANEFYNILKKSSAGESILENLAEIGATAPAAPPSDEGEPAAVTELADLVRQLEGGAAEEAQMDMAERASQISDADDPMAPIPTIEGDAASDNLLDMITDQDDPAEDPMFAMIDNLEDMVTASSSERRVLEGLAKIAKSLRGKGEGFAADVVLSTANSIKGDIVKEASKRAYIVSGLKKIATDLYSSDDQLAGDMVSVTISKLANDDDFGDMDEFMKGMKGGLPSNPMSDKMSDKMKGTQDKLNTQVQKAKTNDKSLYAKSEVGLESFVRNALAESGKLDGFKAMDYLTDRGITGGTAGSYSVELQSGKVVTVQL